MTEPAQPEKQNDKPGAPQSNKPDSRAAKKKPADHPYADFAKEEFGLGGFILAFGAARPPKKREKPVPKVPIGPPAPAPTPAPLTYQEHYAARVATFDYYLRVMNQRRQGERGPDCAIVFSETAPGGEPAKTLTASPALDRMVSSSPDGIIRLDQTISDDPALMDESLTGEIADVERYVQFAFMKDGFYLELPNQTLFDAEATQLMKERSGFFWLRDRRWWFQSLEQWQTLVRDLNPVQKEYLASDTRSAAEDMAWIWYKLWRFPVGIGLYYDALRFGRGNDRLDWEGTGPVI